jgi:hypothetical protein
MGIVVISVPINFQYSNKTEWMDVTEVPDEFTEWIDSCNVPEPVPVNSDKMYTCTYHFDRFIDMITQYKSPGFGSKKKLTPPELIDGTDNNPHIKSTTMQVDRLNIVISASE